MTKFWHVARLVFLERMAYRANFFLEIVGGILASVIVVVLWTAIYRSSDLDRIGGYSLPEMVTYLLGAGLISSIILTTAENPEASQAIQFGDLSGLLIRPVSPHGFWFARDIGNKLFLLLLGCAGYAAVFYLFRGCLVPPAGARHLVLSLAFTILGAVAQFLLFQSLGFLAFWMENTYGIRFAAQVVPYVLLLATALVFLFALVLAIATLSFWTTQSSGLGRIFDSLLKVGRYPVEIFEGIWRTVFIYVLPLVVISQLPSEALLGLRSPLAILPAMGAAGLLLAMSLRFWRAGLARYASASS